MIPSNSLTRSSRFFIVTRFGGDHLHVREMHFDKFNAKEGTCNVSDYGFKRIKLSFPSTIQAISEKAFSTMEEAQAKISSTIPVKD